MPIVKTYEPIVIDKLRVETYNGEPGAVTLTFAIYYK